MSLPALLRTKTCFAWDCQSGSASDPRPLLSPGGAERKEDKSGSGSTFPAWGSDLEVCPVDAWLPAQALRLNPVLLLLGGRETQN